MTSASHSGDTSAESLLQVIRKHPGQTHTYASLSKKLNLTTDQLIAGAKQLALWDYRIGLRLSKGITFFSAPDQLTSAEISLGLNTKQIGRHILAYRTIQSTNDLAAAQAEHGAPEGTIVVADQQTKGRGRLGRAWFSPAGAGIYVSIILRPKFAPELAPGLSLMTALALARTLEKLCPDAVAIKWPNDVLLGGKKVAGILTELSAERDKIGHVIVGVGINVNHGVGHFPDDLKQTATSVRRFLKHKVSRVELLRYFLAQFESEYTHYQKHQLAQSHRQLRKYSSLLGREITVIAGRSRISGIAHDIDIHGRLILRSGSELIPITAGEVTVEKR